MKIPFVVKLGISLSLLTLLLFNFDIPAIAVILARSDLYFVAAAICTLLLFFVISTYKWQMLLKSAASTASYWELLHLNLLGQFYNMVLPGQVGGEVVKSVRLRHFDVSTQRSAVSVLADRSTGLLALLLLGLAGLAFSPSGTQADEIFLPWTLLLIVLLTGLVVFLLTGRGLGFFLRVSNGLPVSRIKRVYAFLDGLNAIRSERTSWRSIWGLFGLSFVAQAVVGLLNLLVCLSLGIHLPIPTIMWITAIVLVAQALPISIAGLGVREGMYVYMLVQQGISAQTALAVSVLMFVAQLTIALLGGVVELRTLLAQKRTLQTR
ncbi:MAG: lysylphosphatidylglycerol synthase transmembrane domain-containing protein [Chloroflexota bacterium]